MNFEKEFDEEFLWRDGKHLNRNLYASTIKQFIEKEIRQVKLDIVIRLDEILAKYSIDRPIPPSVLRIFQEEITNSI